MTSAKPLRERLGMAWRVALGREGSTGFFVTYPHGGPSPGGIRPYPALQSLFDKKKTHFEERIAGFTRFLPDLRQGIEAGSIPWAERDMFPTLDAMAAYCIIREARPARIIEIGSGASSHVMRQALSDNGTGHMTCIDPLPRRNIETLDIAFEKRLLRDDDAHLLQDFSADDVLFIDSSHLMFPGFDTDIEFNRMFPALPRGSLVHVHDVFLPEDYPKRWFDRRYAEQNALIGWIVSGYFEVVYPGFFIASQMAQTLADTLGDLMPESPRDNAGSIWLRKT